MAKIPYSKQSLTQLRRQHALYQRVLPSLDLKRRQLTGEVTKARKQLRADEEKLQAFKEDCATRIPMLANPDIDLSDLVQITRLDVEEVNFVGVRLPELVDLQTEIDPYSLLGKPHWVDPLADDLQSMARHVAELAVSRQRLNVLEKALRRITQRVNLFEKVLIPEAEEMIRKIRIFLADAERAAVVRSKIFKNKLQAQAQRDRDTEEDEA